MDVLGVERRLKEYEAVLHLSFKENGRKYRYEDARLPANFPDHVKEFKAQPVSVNFVSHMFWKWIEMIFFSNYACGQLSIAQ
jgi:Fe-S oxidoreductase